MSRLKGSAGDSLLHGEVGSRQNHPVNQQIRDCGYDDDGLWFRYRATAIILHDGKVLMTGTTDEVVRDETVRRVYLGENFRIV